MLVFFYVVYYQASDFFGRYLAGSDTVCIFSSIYGIQRFLYFDRRLP